MLDNYRTVLRAPGAARFCAAAFVMRLPLSMYPVSFVLLISLRDHDYAFGSYLTAAFILGAAVGGPVLSRVADHRGQRPVVLVWTTVHSAAVAALIVAVYTGAPRWTLLVAALVIGFSYLSVGSLVRARWAALFAGRRELSTAFSLEATIDEVIFVIGPIVASVAATQLGPTAPFWLTGALAAVGAVGLWLAPGGEPVVVGAGVRRGDLPRGPLTLLVAALVGVGLVLGGNDLATVAYVGQAGYAEWSGAVLACFAVGSGVAGVLYGARHWRRPAEQRLPVQAVAFGLLPLLLWAVSSVAVLAPVLFVVGLGTAPMLIVCFGTAERITPPERLTEAMAWVNTGLSIGAGAIAPVIGLVADHLGATVALKVAWPAAVLTALLGGLAALAARRYTARRDGAVTAPWDDGGRAALP